MKMSNRSARYAVKVCRWLLRRGESKDSILVLKSWAPWDTAGDGESGMSVKHLLRLSEFESHVSHHDFNAEMGQKVSERYFKKPIKRLVEHVVRSRVCKTRP